MKELQSPWVHWEGDTQTPGVGKFFKKFPELGKRGNGIDLEVSVQAGNEAWTPKRVEILKRKGVAEVLRPLFCTLDVNLGSAGFDTLASLPGDLFVDPGWEVFEFLAASSKQYEALIKQNDQKILGDDGRQLIGKKGPVDDTFFAFTNPVRVFNGLDAIYNRELLKQKIVDDDFVKDVLHIDFTRPIFSKTRCDLLQFAPQLDAASMNPKAIKEGFRKNLAGKPGAAARLLANLGDPNDARAHKAEVTRFFKACKARPQREFLRDTLIYASQLRGSFRALPIAEFDATLATDKHKTTNKAFDPNTCILK